MIGPLRKTAKKLVFFAAHAADRRKHGDDYGSPLAPGCWDVTITPGGHLAWDGCDLAALAQTYGTPLYVVSKKRLERNYRDFYGSFSALYPNIEIGYSYKTNPLPGVIRALHEFGASAEVISHFELWLAQQLGVPPERIIFNGPAKTENALELAVEMGVKLINIDGPDEIEAIDRLAGRFGRTQQVGARIVTSVGWSGQFGLSIATGAALEAFRQIGACRHLTPCGLHMHLGTGIKSIEIYLRAIREALEFAQRLKRELGIAIKYFDFGGGFGVPTVRPYSELDMKLMSNGYPPRAMDIASAPPLAEYSKAIIDLFSQYYPPDMQNPPTIIFEPGRAISSSAQTLLLKALTIKPAANADGSVILDGGKNIAMPTGYEYHEAFAATRANRPLAATYNIYGPLCHPGDVLFRFKKFPVLEKGDILAIMDAGAYFVPNQMNFSNPRPAAVMVENGNHRLIRQREGFADIVALDVLERI